MNEIEINGEKYIKKDELLKFQRTVVDGNMVAHTIGEIIQDLNSNHPYTACGKATLFLNDLRDWGFRQN